VDFQGLIKSAAAARISGARVRWGLAPSDAREPLAARLYTHHVRPAMSHVVDRHREMAAAAAGAIVEGPAVFRIPEGAPESTLPPGPFVLACPLAGWASKQWPLERYAELAKQLRDSMGMTLVLNGPPESAGLLAKLPGTFVHLSGLPGLIDATRRAAAVVGVDSGPLHLAAALGRAGVAVFGPTDPGRNGPYGDAITVLRASGAETSYKRRQETDPAMRAVSASAVLQALRSKLS
jgi:heptosyltransferase-1